MWYNEQIACFSFINYTLMVTIYSEMFPCIWIVEQCAHIQFKVSTNKSPTRLIISNMIYVTHTHNSMMINDRRLKSLQTTLTTLVDKTLSKIDFHHGFPVYSVPTCTMVIFSEVNAFAEVVLEK